MLERTARPLAGLWNGIASVMGATAALLLDLLRVLFGMEGTEVAATWIVGLVLLSALGAFVTGLTDFKDTATGDERNLAGMHGVINIVGTLALTVSFFARLGGGHDL